MMPIIALLTCIFITYFLGIEKVSDEISLSGKFRQKKLFSIMIKYISPICLLIILIFAILEGVGVITV